jgi:hypothetical protein
MAAIAVGYFVGRWVVESLQILAAGGIVPIF